MVLDSATGGVELVTRYLRDLALRGMSARTCRSYGYGLSRWFRTLWMLKVDLGTCDRIEVDVPVRWIKTARNPAAPEGEVAGRCSWDGESPYGQAGAGGGCGEAARNAMGPGWTRLCTSSKMSLYNSGWRVDGDNSAQQRVPRQS